MLTCYNRGCGQTYDPETNNDESCRHHPGAPYFHDAYKGWSCCKKKSVDFTEFLNIKGCKLSKHSNVKPPEPEKPAKEAGDITEEEKKADVVVVRAPIKESLPRPPVDSPMHKVPTTVAQALRDAIDGYKAEAPVAKVEQNQLAACEVAEGTVCKNSGCTISYDAHNKNTECQYHSGFPIFHEGMKYWSCCQKKTSDFSVFMAQKGCCYGEHKWFKENDDKKEVQCRYDWHQTATNVIVTIYAKMYHYAESTIEVNAIRLNVNLVFPAQENAKFNLELELRGVIDVSKTTAHMYGTKVEITMPKAEPGSWQNLHFPCAKLPAPLSATAKTAEQPAGSSDESDDDFNLDDVELVNAGVRLTEITSNSKDDLD